MAIFLFGVLLLRNTVPILQPSHNHGIIEAHLQVALLAGKVLQPESPKNLPEGQPGQVVGVFQAAGVGQLLCDVLRHGDFRVRVRK